MPLSRAPKLNRSIGSIRRRCWKCRVLALSIVEQGDAAGPAGGSLLDLHRKAAHLEAERRQRLEIGQLFHVAVTNVAAGFVAFPDQARVAGFEEALGGE